MIKKSAFILMAAVVMISGILFADSVKPDAAIVKPVEIKPAAPRIQMAILLDTSGSMSGLINQART